MLEKLVERLLCQSRWLLVPMYVGLVILLLILTITFILDLKDILLQIAMLSEKDTIIAALTLIDLVLVGSLIVMVIISGYESFVSRIDIDVGDDRLNWVGKLDSGTLKLKVASSILAISSVHLLKAFMNVNEIANDKLLWLVIIHITFVVSA